MAACPLLAQDIDETFVFVDENYEVIENGATIVRNLVETTEDGQEIINSGISVLDNGAASNVYLKMKYSIVQIDNGSFQICFPMTCNTQTQVGSYITAPGQVMNGLQDIQSEWFPAEDGACIVKGGAPEPLRGDVNGDGEVNISDVNAVIDAILSSYGYESVDVNKDGEINIADINSVIDIILNPSHLI